MSPFESYSVFTHIALKEFDSSLEIHVRNNNDRGTKKIQAVLRPLKASIMVRMVTPLLARSFDALKTLMEFSNVAQNSVADILNIEKSISWKMQRQIIKINQIFQRTTQIRTKKIFLLQTRTSGERTR